MNSAVNEAVNGAECQSQTRAFVDECVAQICTETGARPEALIPLLQAIQKKYRYLPEAALLRLGEHLKMPLAQITGVASFYSQFRLKPVGKHIIHVCHGTACHVKGAPLVDEALRRHLKIEGDADTDAQGEFTVESVACVGCCSLAPVVQIDGVTYPHIKPADVPRTLRDFAAFSLTPNPSPNPLRGRGESCIGEIRLTVDSCCAAAGALEVSDALQNAINHANAPVAIRPVACTGLCHQVPFVEVAPQNGAAALYANVAPEQAENIVRQHFKARGFSGLKQSWTKLLDSVAGHEETPITRYAAEVRDGPLCAFLGPQKHIATEHYGTLDPLNLDDYLARDGFAALRRAVESMTPEQVIAAVTKSGLRGRGGAGFPTGQKWLMAARADSDRKFVICNGDEGDPGAFMDRMLLESFPYRVLEGMALAAFAVGAREGIFYVRAEYPHSLARLREAIARCEERNLFDDLSLKLRVVEGAGAFVCGEETALIASLEGQRGEPRLRPPYPAQSGLWGEPTCINNVETYACVPWILRHGADAYAKIGTEKSKGTKVFSLAGAVRRGGLIEVPMGTTIREIVEKIGGGVAPGRTFKAVQIGGPSGGCVPASLADTPVDYEALKNVGAIMGSGGLVVLDDRTCMVDMARYFLEFLRKESCGQCTMCRVGTARLHELLEKLCAGKARPGDLEKIEELAHAIGPGSLCGLGQTAPNPVLSTLRHFREEYEAHLRGQCPARQCPALIRYHVLPHCTGCTLCAQACPTAAIALRPLALHEVQDELCVRCDACRVACPESAVEVVQR